MRKVDADMVQCIADCELDSEQAGLIQYVLAHTPILPDDGYQSGYEQGLKDAIRHAYWELGTVSPGYFTPGGNRPWVCSHCKTAVSWMLDRPREKYCSECGAKMDGE